MYYTIGVSLFQHLMMCLACTPYLIPTDDALHLYQKSALVLMICFTCTACISLGILDIILHGHIGCTQMKRNDGFVHLKPAFSFFETCTTYAFRLFVNERGISCWVPKPGLRCCIVYFLMTLNTQSLRIFAKSTLCILDLKVVSFTGFRKYVK